MGATTARSDLNITPHKNTAESIDSAVVYQVFDVLVYGAVTAMGFEYPVQIPPTLVHNLKL